jgi:hypothetical protein
MDCALYYGHSLAGRVLPPHAVGRLMDLAMAKERIDSAAQNVNEGESGDA